MWSRNQFFVNNSRTQHFTRKLSEQNIVFNIFATRKVSWLLPISRIWTSLQRDEVRYYESRTLHSAILRHCVPQMIFSRTRWYVSKLAELEREFDIGKEPNTRLSISAPGSFSKRLCSHFKSCSLLLCSQFLHFFEVLFCKDKFFIITVLIFVFLLIGVWNCRRQNWWVINDKWARKSKPSKYWPIQTTED